MSERYLAICIPGREEDGSDSAWFVIDNEADPDDMSRSVCVSGREEANALARTRNLWIGFVVRVGDADDYHVEHDIGAVAERLRDHGIRRLDGWTLGGVFAEGYRRDNYISLFFGKHDPENGSTPQREITPDEYSRLNRLVGGL
jgi:hypothetical protein